MGVSCRETNATQPGFPLFCYLAMCVSNTIMVSVEPNASYAPQGSTILPFAMRKISPWRRWRGHASVNLCLFLGRKKALPPDLLPQSNARWGHEHCEKRPGTFVGPASLP